MAKEYKVPFVLEKPELLKFDAFVNNEWVQSKTGARFEVIDPGTDTAWASCPIFTAEDVPQVVETAQAAFQKFARTSPRQRAEWLTKWDGLIKEHKMDIAKILTHEAGKPIGEAAREVDFSTASLLWFAGEAERIEGTVATTSFPPGRRAFTIKQPIGVTVGLIPWNFPIGMFLRKISPALAAGCPMIVKPSPETPLSTLALAYLAAKAGFPPGVITVLTTDLDNTPSLSEALCRHPLVRKVTFTGSTRVGKIIAAHCAQGVKKVTLELGGNSPYIVFDDANLSQAATSLMMVKWINAGQACISANRIYVQSGVYEKFAEIIKEQTGKIVVGHGSVPNTTMGPLTSPRGLVKVINQIDDATKLGAKVILGGHRVLGNPGYFIEPTILKDMTTEMLISREESFAPVLALYKFETEEEVTELANDTSMGLASYVFTKNVDRIWRMFENLEAGMVGLNSV
ncbi:succinate-semialdehyde dehydrogenase, putative [Talaromyces stipitatus ATCC 10500]|uniref:Succinate-semialdehyde dehydrogenase, putative n=1 Tax=Talaromyces stipitatus (strain ATCC 10500 / CBS 375.48 / QM 6759 / NRRL 1006) TaxID=441959 RepID=B8MMI1_TALSN|nr:succinate-semialdehyde dehydrogenase, putative [Talaromyces stipitatus ATCC 10500]EED13734.1 succinate-semialdehyde dehydrogenase, putative [Talaromyces stipitatus ATCC 10500]